MPICRYAHSAGVVACSAESSGLGEGAPYLSKVAVRAILLLRLHLILQGGTGISPDAANLYLEFLNQRIFPCIPSRGSVGMADITTLSHIGLAMMGEYSVTVGDSLDVRDAAEVLATFSLAPLVPWAKDTLAIISSNAGTAARAALAVAKASTLLTNAELVASLSQV